MNISLRDITLSFDGKTILDSFSAELAGRAVCLFGPSGCGKTTLLNVMAGLVQPASGTMRGVPDKVGYVFQEDRLLPWMSARENVQQVLPKEREAEADEWLRRMGFTQGDCAKRPGELSGGMARRAAVALALAFGAELLLLDEPFQGLDDARKFALIDLLKENLQDRSLILVTHDMDEALALCETVVHVDGPPLRFQALPE